MIPYGRQDISQQGIDAVIDVLLSIFPMNKNFLNFILKEFSL